MRATTIKGPHYKDSLTRKRRRSFFIKSLIAGLIIFAIIAGAFYLVFFSSVFMIKSVTIKGLEDIPMDSVNSEIEKYKERKIWGFIPVGRNVLFFDPQSIKDDLLNKYDNLRDINIDRDNLRSLIMNFAERDPIGVWCFENYITSNDKCKYFDESMSLWGEVGKSTGFVLLTILDEKQFDEQIIDKEYFDAILLTIRGLRDVANIKRVIIPKNAVSDIRFSSNRGYDLIFSLDSSIVSQIEVLKIFLNNKKDDANFKPQYIDLRIDGRVYYK